MAIARASSDEKVIDGQKRALELALHGASLHDVLDVLVRTVEAQSTAGVLGSILLLDSDRRHLRHGAAPSLPDAYNAAIDGIEIGPGSCGTAAFTAKTVIVGDIESDPLWSAFKMLAAQHGLRACWSTPIFSSKGEVLGTFALYHRVVAIPSDRDREIVDLLGSTAALVIERDVHARERSAAEAAMRAAQAVELSRLAAMFAHAPAAIAVLRGDDHVFEVANQSYLELIGHRPIAGKPVAEALPEIRGQGFIELLDNVRRAGEPYVGRSQRVMVARTPNGGLEEAFFDFVYQPVPGADGKTDAILVVAFEVTVLVHAKLEAEPSRTARSRPRSVPITFSNTERSPAMDARSGFATSFT